MFEVKGAFVIDGINYLVDKAGKDGLEKVKEKLTPEDREILFSKTLLAFNWYDFNAFLRFLFAADKTLFKGEQNFVREVGLHSAASQMGGIYKALFRFASVKLFALGGSGSYSSIVRPGKMKITLLDETTLEFRLSDSPGMILNHEIYQGAIVEGILALFKVTDIKTLGHPKCIARGDDHCIFLNSFRSK